MFGVNTRTVNTTAHCLNFLAQTADLRFSPRWESVRQLLAARGHAAKDMILFSCDHAGGPDMSVWFALADGEIVESVMRKDAATHNYTSIVEWRSVARTNDDEEWALAHRIMTTRDLAAAFAKAVESFYDFHSRSA